MEWDTHGKIYQNFTKITRDDIELLGDSSPGVSCISAQLVKQSLTALTLDLHSKYPGKVEVVFPSTANDIYLESWKTDIASPSGAAGRHVLWSPKLRVPLLQWNLLHVVVSSALLCVTGSEK